MTTELEAVPRVGQDGRARSDAEVFARTLTRRALRSFGVLTADARPVPDLLIIGAKRGGTTSLWYYLSEHPGMLPLFPRAEKRKGTYYFDENFSEGIRWYRSHFPTAATRALAQRRLGHPVVAIDASPYYLYHPLAPSRAAAVTPDALVVAVLRDPVERAYSHYKERKRNGTEPLSFAEAIAAEPERIAGEEEQIRRDGTYVSFGHRHCSYLDQGRYAPMLSRWFDAFGRDRVLVEVSEEMYEDPQPTVDRVTRRLGMPTQLLHNAEPFNAEPDSGLDPATREHLRRLLDPDIRAVEELLGRVLPW
jgi:hypothetical protein